MYTFVILEKLLFPSETPWYVCRWKVAPLLLLNLLQSGFCNLVLFFRMCFCKMHLLLH